MVCRTALVVSALLAVPLTAAEAKITDKERLQGSWVIDSAEIEGKPFDRLREDGGLLIFDGDMVTQRSKGNEEKATYRIDSTRKPKEIDIMPEGEKGAVGLLRGIYDLDGNTLKICLGKMSFNKESKERGESKRPPEFDSKHGVLIVFKREKK